MEIVLNRDKIRGVMAEKKITQRDLANNLNLSENQISKKIKGLVDFKVSEFLKLCFLLDSSPNIFLTEVLIK